MSKNQIERDDLMRTALLVVVVAVVGIIGINYLGWFQIPPDKGIEFVVTGRRL